jgi:glycosyltransferase involved in cell wall biosynthesis
VVQRPQAFVTPVSKPRLLFLITEDWYFWSHRLDLARAAREAGFEVLVATRVRAHGERIVREGFKLLPIRITRRNWYPWRELAAVMELVGLYRRERPDIVHHVAMKPILYGSVAARLVSVHVVVNAFAGLGYIFIATGRWVGWVRVLLGIALRWTLALPQSRVVFQNAHDRELLIHEAIVQPSQTVVIRGSGINTETFAPSPEPAGEPLVVLASRMLWDKGVGEFVEAARLLKAQGIRARFVLAGMVDEENPAQITERRLRTWQDEGLVEWWGHQDDMRRVLSAAHVVVLPSYREGLPKVLLEAAACARPIVATDVPGCREVVRDGDNGILVPPKDSHALAAAIEKLVQEPALRARMGAQGRALVVKEFSVERIAGETLGLYRELLRQARSAHGAASRV